MAPWLGLSAIHTALLWGAALVSAPILIHLLSRRRFRLVHWAAMDFLLEADRRNRRRVQMEQLLLLLLRCLAVLLIVALVSRLFIQPSGLAARAIEAARSEHVVLLDDSPSTELRLGGKTLFEQCKADLVEFVRQTARNHPGDTLTLVLTSQPSQPVLSGKYLTGNKLEAVIRTIDKLAVGDRAASYDVALSAVEELLTGPRASLNRSLTVLTDLRRRDWLPAGAGEAPAAAQQGPLGAIRRLAERVDNLSVIHFGGPREPNLAVTEIALGEKSVQANVPARFEVLVRNYSDTTASHVDVALTAGEAPPQHAEIDAIEPNGQAAVPFTLTFRDPGPVALRAELPADHIPRDNVRQRAVNVTKGTSILLVDGRPSAERGQNETFFLEKALDPPGQTASGNVVEVITESQFEDLSLDRFQVIVLANVYRVSEGRAAALEAWVRAGGGLAVFLGDQVDDGAYNQRLYNGGKGLLPLQLNHLAGDESERRWSNLNPAAANHPILRAFEGADNPFLARVKFFRWWGSTVGKEDLAAGRVQVLASFNDAENSPALVEGRFGKGRVLVSTSAADARWNNWPADPSYLVTVLEITRHLTAPDADPGAVPVGTPLRVDLDATLYSSEAQLDVPAGAPASAVRATPSDNGRRLQLAGDEMNVAGGYRLHVKRHDGTQETLLFAANVDPTEGDLQPADPIELRRRLGESKAQFVESRAWIAQSNNGAKVELWRSVLLLLAVTLGLEQGLGWWFGRKYG